MRGQQVIARTYGNKPAIRRVWDVGEKLVYITSERQYQALIAGQDAPWPVGFPMEDIYEYTPEIAAELMKSQDWSQLKQWRPREG